MDDHDEDKKRGCTEQKQWDIEIGEIGQDTRTEVDGGLTIGIGQLEGFWSRCIIRTEKNRIGIPWADNLTVDGLLVAVFTGDDRVAVVPVYREINDCQQNCDDDDL